MQLSFLHRRAGLANTGSFVIPVWGEAIEILINIAVKILLNFIVIEVAVTMVTLLGLHFQYSILTSLYILVVL